MTFKATINKKTVEVTSKLPADNYSKYLDKFISEFTPVIRDPKKLIEIITPLLELKSWRLLNREVRRACDQYCTDNGIMDHATYQAKFFYEGSMIGRTTYGKDAPWIGDTTKVQKVNKVAKTDKKADKVITVDRADMVQPVKKTGKQKEHVWDPNDQWDVVNRGIAERVAE